QLFHRAHSRGSPTPPRLPPDAQRSNTRAPHPTTDCETAAHTRSALGENPPDVTTKSHNHRLCAGANLCAAGGGVEGVWARRVKAGAALWAVEDSNLRPHPCEGHAA